MWMISGFIFVSGNNTDFTADISGHDLPDESRLSSPMSDANESDESSTSTDEPDEELIDNRQTYAHQASGL